MPRQPTALESERDSAPSDGDPGPGSGRFCSCRPQPFPFAGEEALADKSADALAETIAEDDALGSITDLSAGEVSILAEELDGRGGELELTDRRVIVRGSPYSNVLFSSMSTSRIASISVLRVPQGRRTLYWGFVGLAAAVGVWQSLDGTGNLRLAVTAVVALAAVGLLVAHLIRPPNIRLVFTSVSGGELFADFSYDRLEIADRFAVAVRSRVESLRSARRMRREAMMRRFEASDRGEPGTSG